MRILRLLALALALVAGDRSLAAQDTPEQQEVRAVVDRMFDAMRAGDSTALRPLFHPTARLQSVSIREGRMVLRGDSIDPFIRAVGTPHDKVWDERISDVEIRVDGPLATAWMNYAFYLDDQFSHCGVNAFQFVRMEAGWQIIQITDTRRKECAWIEQAAPR